MSGFIQEKVGVTLIEKNMTSRRKGKKAEQEINNVFQ